MRFKSIAIPKVTQGVSFVGEVDQVVPDQSMSLAYILERFTRGEAVPVGHEGHFDEESDIDLEKLQKADLVDKAEYVERLEDVKKRHEKQEKAKAVKKAEADALAAKVAEEKRIRIAARKLAKENSAKGGSA